MRRFVFFIIFAFCYTFAASAQGTDHFTAVLQHGSDVSFYKGSTAFQQAYDAAVDGDVIILSEGTFQPVSRIEKSLSIYGAGFENNPETNTAVTAISGEQKVGKTSGETLDGFHIEGIKIMGNMNFDLSELKNATIQKCYITGSVYFQKNIENVIVKQCRIGDSVLGQTDFVANGLFLTNCYVAGNARTFSYDSFVQIDHCYVAQYGGNDKAKIILTNTIIGGSSFYGASGIAPYSTIENCIVFSNAGEFPYYTLVGIYHTVDLATIFADADNANYSETRTFELKDPNTYQGTDGTPIGPAGGEGWNKVPAKPSIANFNTSVSGTYLNVTYDADVK